MTRKEELTKNLNAALRRVSEELGDVKRQKILAAVASSQKSSTLEEIHKYAKIPMDEVGAQTKELCILGYVEPSEGGYILTEFTKALFLKYDEWVGFEDTLIHMYA